MRFRFLTTIGAVLLIFVGQSTFGGPIGIDFDFNVGNVEDNPDITEVLMQRLFDDSDELHPMFAATLLQSLLGTPFAIVPPVVDLIFTAMVNIAEEEENLQVVGDVDEVLQLLQPILYSELGFIRLVCDDLTVEQRAQIRTAAEASLKRSALKMVSAHEPDHAVVVGVLLDKQPDPLTEIREEIDNVMKEVLTAEKYEQYADLAASRVTHRKRAAILAIVAQLDECLCLTLQQREEILDRICSHWQDEWEQWLEWNMDISKMPKDLDPIVSPILDKSQAAVWKQTPKSESDYGCVFDDEAASHFHDGWWGEIVPMNPDEDGEEAGFSF
jgi:hypothetical protein